MLKIQQFTFQVHTENVPLNVWKQILRVQT